MSLYARPPPTPTAFEIALQFHLAEMEKREGRRLNVCQAPKTAPLFKYTSLFNSAWPAEIAEGRREKLRSMDRYTKAIYHVLAVYDFTFRYGMDANKFYDKHRNT
jgi:hypothetical protein